MDTVKLNLRFRFITLVSGLLITVGITSATFFFQAHLDIKELATVAAAGLALTALIYSALTFHANLEINAKKLALEKQQVSLGLIGEWHKPDMAKLTIISYVLRKETKDLEPAEVVTLLKGDTSKREAVVAVLNYFEKVALAIHIGTADEAPLRDYFGGVVRLSYHALKGFIDSKRTENNDAGVFIRFEELAKRWNV